jgi:hypothetical protein
MIYCSGEIDVHQVTTEAQREREQLAAWLERCRKRELRREEEMVLQEYWRTEEGDRGEVVRKYPEVFERIRANRREAARIEARDRAFMDLHMRRLGYVIRPGGDWPRYVRPECGRSTSGSTPKEQEVMNICSSPLT